MPTWFLSLPALALLACNPSQPGTPLPPTPTPEASTPTPSGAGPLELIFPYSQVNVTRSSLEIFARVHAEAPPRFIRGTLDGEDISSTLYVEESDQSLRSTPIALDRLGLRKLELLISMADGTEGAVRVEFYAFPGQALATQVGDARALIQGPEARGMLGDYLLQNDKIQVLIAAPGRIFDAINAFGGHPVDAERMRSPWEPTVDGLGGVVPAINIESTDNPQSIEVVNDGRDGGAAIVRTRGPDDLLQTVNPSTMAPLLIPAELSSLPIGTYIPASADDKDISTEITNTYTLEPGKNYLTYETTVRNNGSASLALYLGDYLNATAQMDYFSPGFGFRANIYFRHEGDFFAWSGYETSAGLAYGLIPTVRPTTTISLPGTILTFSGQDAQLVVVESDPPKVRLEAGQSITLKRYLVVGEQIADVSAVRCQLVSGSCGTISGTVTQQGTPVAGADVTLWRPTTSAELYMNRDKQVVTHWRTGPDGTYAGLVPAGQYYVSANLPHSPYPGTGVSPPQRSVQIAEALPIDGQDFDFPATGGFQVQVQDEQGNALAARVSLVGFDPSTDPLVKPLIYPGYDSTGALFSDLWADPLPFGVARVALTDATGSTGFVPVEPGEYELVVSRGPFYSIQRRRIVIAAEQVLEVSATLTRVVDPVGFLSGDFHVHGIDSFDASIPRDFRLRGMAAENVDVFAATDHGIRIDFNQDIARLGLEGSVVALIGEEVTTFDLGHFNAFPLEAHAGSRTFGGINWGAEAAPGQSYMSAGSYDLSPSELMDKVRSEASLPVLMANHPNTPTLGYFSLIGLDSGQSPPRAYVPTCLGRQAPETNLWSDHFDALELWRLYEDSPTLLFEENLGDWFNLLNQGIVRTSLSNSDSHSRNMIPAGSPRNLVAIEGDIPFNSEALGLEVAQAIRQGRVINTNAPFVNVEVEAVGSGSRAGLSAQLPTLVSAPDGQIVAHIKVQSPAWAAYDQVVIFVNAATIPSFDDGDDAPGRTYPFSNCPGSEITITDVPRYRPEIEQVWNFNLGAGLYAEPVMVSNLEGATRLESTLDIPISLERDSWIVVLVRGNEGISPPLFPVQPQGLNQDSNNSLDALTDGNQGEGGVLAQAFTNPIFVDVDGDGRFQPPGLQLRAGAGLRTRTLRWRAAR